MEVNFDFLRAMQREKISLNHLLKVVDYLQEHEGELIIYKEASRILKIEAFEFGRVVRFLLQQRAIKIEIDGQTLKKKISFTDAEHIEKGIEVLEKQDITMAKMPYGYGTNGTEKLENQDTTMANFEYHYGKNAIEVWQKEDTSMTTMENQEQQDTKNAIALSGNNHSTMAKMPYRYGKNAIALWQSSNNSEPVKERKEKRTKKEKKENICFLEKEKEKEKEREKEKPVLPSWMPLETWNAYVDMRKKIKHPLTDYAVRLYCKAFERLKQGGISETEIIEAIETSIAKGWQGIFVDGTDILKLKPNPISPITKAKKVENFGGISDKEFYERWKQSDEILKKEAKEKEAGVKGVERGDNEDLKPVGTLVQNLLGNLETKKPSRDERLKMGWGIKTYTSGFV